MKVVCAWCRKSPSEPDGAGGPISHGICRACADTLEFTSSPLPAFLETLAGPVMMVDAEGRVLGANAAFAGLVGKPAAAIASRLGGDVISCVYAEMPGGCGETVHCTGCAIRRAVNETRTTGQPRTEVPAFALIRGPDGPLRILFHVSLQRVGSTMVLVRVDDAQLNASPDTSPGGTNATCAPPIVLVADDDEAVRRLLARLLSKAGYRVLESSNGKDATRQVIAERVDLVITDLVMPEQEGIETVIQLRKLLPDLGIVAISGAFAGGMLDAARLLGADATLPKPISADQLLDTVRHVTALHRP
jgi:CheY-like chemotaxis protein